MAGLISQIEALQLKISKLASNNQELKEALTDQSTTIEALQQQLDDEKASKQVLANTIIDLKTANAMLGSDDYKRKTKLKLNALIREIDDCITQLEGA